jgi:hypothetical protein
MVLLGVPIYNQKYNQRLKFETLKEEEEKEEERGGGGGGGGGRGERVILKSEPAWVGNEEVGVAGKGGGRICCLEELSFPPRSVLPFPSLSLSLSRPLCQKPSLFSLCLMDLPYVLKLRKSHAGDGVVLVIVSQFYKTGNWNGVQTPNISIDT